MKISRVTKYDKFFIYGLFIFLIPFFISVLLVFNFIDFETPRNFPKSQDSVFTKEINPDTLLIKPIQKKKKQTTKKAKSDTIKLKKDSI